MRGAGGRCLILLNASLGAGQQSSLRVVGERIAALGVAAQPGDICVDLRGDRVLPGLINAHDHLQLNALPRLKYRDRHAHVTEWIDDIRPRLKSDPMLVANSLVPRQQRLLIGGIKNLLSGVTTVAHHDPWHPCLQAADFPVRVLAEQAWSHSLALDGAPAVKQACEQTPPGWPWIVHAAEGIDAAAAAEFDELEMLGCIRPNTLLVHGLALDPERQRRLVQAGAGLVWCPGSNWHLFGRCLDIGMVFGQRRLALGSDSRVSGERDLLAELRVARELSGLDDADLELLVTERAASLLRLGDRGALRPDLLADLVVLPAGLPLSRACRADIRLVLMGGEPRYADADLASALGVDADLDEVRVDGRKKYLARTLVSRLDRSPIGEPGLDTGLAVADACA